MKAIKTMQNVPWPEGDLTEDFTFNAIHPDGVFNFDFKYFNNRWNCWCTLPSGEKRIVGIEPNITSWNGFLNYGILIKTYLQKINKNSLPLTSLYIISWE